MTVSRTRGSSRDPVRIGNAHGFWGDRLTAAAEMLALEPDLDFLTLDFLAEVSMSVLALQRSRDAGAGWPRDFVEIVRSIAPYWQSGGRCRVITNAGGLDPIACAQACREALQAAGCTDRVIAAVTGDDVLDQVRRADRDVELLRNLDTGEPMATVQDRLVTANAYLGSLPIVEALARGADLVITGRVADPSLTVAACIDHFGWPPDQWDRLACATVAGHLIECGAQVTGGIATGWLQVPDVAQIGFPIVEVADDGSCVVTKPRGSGGCVCQRNVKEQLVYEIADPVQYLSPDVSVSFLSLQVEDQGGDRVAVRGARGGPPPPAYKVSATYRDGFRAQGQLTIFGRDAVAKARRAGQAVLDRLCQSGHRPRESVVECLGAGACHPQGFLAGSAQEATEVVLRIAVADDSRETVERFAQELMPLVTAGPQGTTGYAEGRPRVHPMFRFWPCLIGRDRVQPQVAMLGSPDPERHAARSEVLPRHESFSSVPISLREMSGVSRSETSTTSRADGKPQRLGDIADARSGDKGIHANIGVIARCSEDFPRVCREVTPERVARFLHIADPRRISRFELPNLGAVNLVIRGILANPLRADAQGKALGQVLLEMPLEET